MKSFSRFGGIKTKNEIYGEESDKNVYGDREHAQKIYLGTLQS